MGLGHSNELFGTTLRGRGTGKDSAGRGRLGEADNRRYKIRLGCLEPPREDYKHRYHRQQYRNEQQQQQQYFGYSSSKGRDEQEWLYYSPDSNQNYYHYQDPHDFYDGYDITPLDPQYNVVRYSTKQASHYRPCSQYNPDMEMGQPRRIPTPEMELGQPRRIPSHAETGHYRRTVDRRVSRRRSKVPSCDVVRYRTEPNIHRGFEAGEQHPPVRNVSQNVHHSHRQKTAPAVRKDPSESMVVRVEKHLSESTMVRVEKDPFESRMELNVETVQQDAQQQIIQNTDANHQQHEQQHQYEQHQYQHQQQHQHGQHQYQHQQQQQQQSTSESVMRLPLGLNSDFIARSIVPMGGNLVNAFGQPVELSTSRSANVLPILKIDMPKNAFEVKVIKQPVIEEEINRPKRRYELAPIRVDSEQTFLSLPPEMQKLVKDTIGTNYSTIVPNNTRQSLKVARAETDYHRRGQGAKEGKQRRRRRMKRRNSQHDSDCFNLEKRVDNDDNDNQPSAAQQKFMNGMMQQLQEQQMAEYRNAFKEQHPDLQLPQNQNPKIARMISIAGHELARLGGNKLANVTSILVPRQSVQSHQTIPRHQTLPPHHLVPPHQPEFDPQGVYSMGSFGPISPRLVDYGNQQQEYNHHNEDEKKRFSSNCNRSLSVPVGRETNQFQQQQNQQQQQIYAPEIACINASVIQPEQQQSHTESVAAGESHNGNMRQEGNEERRDIENVEASAERSETASQQPNETSMEREQNCGRRTNTTGAMGLATWDLCVSPKLIKTFQLSTLVTRRSKDKDANNANAEDPICRSVNVYCLCDNPELIHFSDFLSKWECEAFLQLAESAGWKPAVPQYETGKKDVGNGCKRSGRSWALSPVHTMKHPLTGAIKNRVATLLGRPSEEFGPLSVLRCLPPSGRNPKLSNEPVELGTSLILDDECQASSEENRKATAMAMMIYLSDGIDGNLTTLLHLGASFTPQFGSALSWPPNDWLLNGEVDMRLVRAVTEGVLYCLPVLLTKQCI